MIWDIAAWLFEQTIEMTNGISFRVNFICTERVLTWELREWLYWIFTKIVAWKFEGKFKIYVCLNDSESDHQRLNFWLEIWCADSFKLFEITIAISEITFAAVNFVVFVECWSVVRFVDEFFRVQKWRIRKNFRSVGKDFQKND